MTNSGFFSGEPLVREAALSERIVAHIMERVLNGTLAPGTRVPPERVLAEQYGVSRTVIREAMRMLASKGVLQSKVGSGTYISGPDPAAVAESMKLLLRLHQGGVAVPHDLVHEVRRILELEIAGLAARRARPEDLEPAAREVERQRLLVVEAARTDDPGLAREVERQRHLDGVPAVFAASDVAFHAALATATRNPLFPVLLNSIADVMLEVRIMGVQVTGGLENGLRHHTAILEAVAAGDEGAARAAMQAHLADSERFFQRGLQIEASRAGQGGAVRDSIGPAELERGAVAL